MKIVLLTLVGALVALVIIVGAMVASMANTTTSSIADRVDSSFLVQ